MRPLPPLLLLWLLAPPPAAAQSIDHTHAGHSLRQVDAPDKETIKNGQAPFVLVTINPESKVSATLEGPAPPALPCGTPLNLRVKIVNQGAVTAPLRAQLVAPPRGVALQWSPAPLSGRPLDAQDLQLASSHDQIADITLAFRIRAGIGDLAGRDRVHFVLRCIKPTASAS